MRNRLTVWARCLVLCACSLSAATSMGAEQSAAQRAVEAAKKYAGTTLTVHWQAGLQALDPKNYTGPLWEQLTGIKIKVIETPLAEVFTKTLQEFRAGTGSFDVLDVVPSWMPDLARAGALEPLDSFIERFGYREEIESIAPAFRDNQTKVGGRVFGIPDDGDVFILYFRKDLFSDQHLKAEFQKRFGYALAPPATWQQFSDTASFFTEQLKKDGMYGATLADDPSLAQYMFQMRFRGEGGKFFNPKTMKATVNTPAGVKVFHDMRNENRFMPPGVEKFTFADNLAVFLNGNAAMTVGWPPIGRWAAGYGTEEKALGFVPKSKIAGKVGYALPPGKNPQLAIGHCLSVSANSKYKEAAYLFIQWMNSEEVSLKRVTLPTTLRDPFRMSHFASPEYRKKWPDAHEYLDTLKRAAQIGLTDLSVLQTDKYEEALRAAISRLWAGEESQRILDDLAAQWDAITERLGAGRQRAAYVSWAARRGAYPENSR